MIRFYISQLCLSISDPRFRDFFKWFQTQILAWYWWISCHMTNIWVKTCLSWSAFNVHELTIHCLHLQHPPWYLYESNSCWTQALALAGQGQSSHYIFLVMKTDYWNFLIEIKTNRLCVQTHVNHISDWKKYTMFPDSHFIKTSIFLSRTFHFKWKKIHRPIY